MPYYVVQVWDKDGYLMLSRNFNSKIWAQAFKEQQEEEDDDAVCTIMEQLSIEI